MKNQFDKKRRSPQGLKTGGPFRISKDIRSGAFELELLEGWMIHNIFHEDLLT